MRLGAVALGLVLVADTYHHHRPQVMTAHPDIYRTRPASLERLEGLPQPARVSFHFTPAARDYIERSSPSAEGRGDPLAVLREIYLRNLPMLYDVQSVHGLVPTWPWRFETLHAFLSKRHDPLQRPLTDFLNARLLIDADEKDTQPTLRTIRFEANPRALPRATLVHRQSHRAFTGAAALADWLTSNDFNPREEVWLEETHHVAHPPPGVHPAPPRAGAPQGVAADRVQITRYEPERIEMQVESTAPGYLVVADQFFPGWRAEVAGRAGSQANVSTGPLARGSRSTSARPSMPAAASRRAEVLRANLCFRAVAVDAGVFTVTMTYRPWTVALGGVLSAVAALVAAGLGVFGRARSQQSTR